MAASPPPPPTPFRAVIVGAGIAGAAAAAEMCRARPDAAVTLVSREARVKVRFMMGLLWACVPGLGRRRP
jgi:flavin-dependent dehydrogenase